MAAEWGFLLFFVLLQLAAIFALASHARAASREAIASLVALFALNGAAVAFLALRVAGWADASFWIDLTDAPTGGLIAAYAFFRLNFRKSAFALVGVGAALALAVAFFPVDHSLSPDSWLHTLAIPGLLYVALALCVAVSVRGEGVDPWIALAFYPRLGLFFAQGVLVLPQSPLGWTSHALMIASFAVATLFLLGYRKTVGGPTMTIVAAAMLAGPLDAFAIAFLPPGGPNRSFLYAVFYQLTLAVLRPIVILNAFAPERLKGTLSRASISTVAGTIVLVGTSLLDVSPLASVAAALSTGVFALFVLEAYEERVQGNATAVPTTRRPPPPARPYWQTLLVALMGSERHTGGPVDPAWTQKGLAERTGISARRVSEFGASINEGAAAKLARHLPKWQEMVPDETAPRLIETKQGLAAGSVGTRKYYQLTPLGRALADALAHDDEAGGASVDSTVKGSTINTF